MSGIKTVVLNGCFDCLHDGHKHLLTFAKKVCRKTIIILLNSDNSVRQLKGKGRPVEDYKTRKINIYDYWKHNLVCFGGSPNIEIYDFDTEEELYNLLKQIQPGMIIKGNDRPDVREIMGSINWPVCIVPRLKDKSGKDISTTEQMRVCQSE